MGVARLRRFPTGEGRHDDRRRGRSPTPPTSSNASYQQQGNQGVTEIVEIKGRGHALTIDSGWHEVAEVALAFVKRSS
jgi:hypothetical protein